MGGDTGIIFNMYILGGYILASFLKDLELYQSFEDKGEYQCNCNNPSVR